MSQTLPINRVEFSRYESVPMADPDDQEKEATVPMSGGCGCFFKFSVNVRKRLSRNYRLFFHNFSPANKACFWITLAIIIVLFIGFIDYGIRARRFAYEHPIHYNEEIEVSRVDAPQTLAYSVKFHEYSSGATVVRSASTGLYPLVKNHLELLSYPDGSNAFAINSEHLIIDCAMEWNTSANVGAKVYIDVTDAAHVRDFYMNDQRDREDRAAEDEFEFYENRFLELGMYHHVLINFSARIYTNGTVRFIPHILKKYSAPLSESAFPAGFDSNSSIWLQVQVYDPLEVGPFMFKATVDQASFSTYTLIAAIFSAINIASLILNCFFRPILLRTGPLSGDKYDLELVQQLLDKAIAERRKSTETPPDQA